MRKENRSPEGLGRGDQTFFNHSPFDKADVGELEYTSKKDATERNARPVEGSHGKPAFCSLEQSMARTVRVPSYRTKEIRLNFRQIAAGTSNDYVTSITNNEQV